MKTFFLNLVLLFFFGYTTIAQELFDSDELLEISLTGEMKKLLRDKSDDPQYYPLTFGFADGKGENYEIEIKARTRGNFRRRLGNCEFLPLLLKFPKSDEADKSIFSGQKRLKLVMPCSGEDYVVREYLVYKLYNLLTPYSFSARLVRVNLNNTQSKKGTETFYGILLEDEDDLAERNEMESKDLRMQPILADREQFLLMAVFQYMIGNTDWSVDFMQNIKLLRLGPKTRPIAVPYDFDHAGIVSAPYAKPSVALKLRSVRERRYRGYCIKDLAEFEMVLSHFEKIKDDIYATYKDCEYLEEKSKTFSLEYLDDFFKTISDEDKWHKEFSYPCDPNGTGKVIIRGMKG